MNKTLIIVASIPLFAGASALMWAFEQRQKDRDEITDYQSRYAAQTEDFVRQYDEWLQMPPEQRQELEKLPLLLDKDGQTKSREQLRLEQQGRFKANVNKLLAGVVTNPSLADLLYGDNWRQELRQYEQRKAFIRSVLIGSVVCTSAGGLVYLVWMLLFGARVCVKTVTGLTGLAGSALHVFGQDKKEGKTQEGEKVDPGIEIEKDTLEELTETETDEQQSKSKERPRIPVRPVATAMIDRPRRTLGSLTQRPEINNKQGNGEANALVADAKDEADETTETPAVHEPVRLDLTESPKPIDNTLNDLTEQVSAIREYAANQQDRLEKLQDGYDWNIIRTFCLRVIRCVDNLENRIAQKAKQDSEATALKEVRDELIFALESSGIEQFEPETNSEYRGQEKLAEAVKDKLKCDDPQQTGKIANVIRPGYQYFINEEQVKIVRPAQVRLYA
jgi:molecular chaperone GrpE (heat shock protein)